MNNYSNGKIYQILCLETGDRYIGSCVTTLTQRLHGHMQKNNRCSSRKIVERGNYNMLLLEDFPCSNKKELTTRERFYFDLLPNINRNRPMRMGTEITEYQKVYNQTNREKIVEYKKKYRLENKDKITEYEKKYRLENKDKITEYRLDNRVKIAENMKRYRLEKGEKLKNMSQTKPS